jgi:hypothetical protein
MKFVPRMMLVTETSVAEARLDSWSLLSERQPDRRRGAGIAATFIYLHLAFDFLWRAVSPFRSRRTTNDSIATDIAQSQPTESFGDFLCQTIRHFCPMAA